jgi:hypothetical protein
MQVVAFECMHYIQVVVGVFLPSWFNTLTLDSWIYTVWFEIHVKVYVNSWILRLLIFILIISFTQTIYPHGGYFIDDS